MLSVLLAMSLYNSAILRSIVGHSVVHTHDGLGASARRFTKLGRFIEHSSISVDTLPIGRQNLCSMFRGWLVATLKW